eukprot:m.18778 g.18778  ORF g.18778 m.18778 type:complete len:980 (-) comp3370_c0_seq2:1998-4937(-)
MDAVLNAVVCATSQDPRVFKPAVDQLQAWEVQRGYHLRLVEIFASQEPEIPIRWMAIVCFKNGVDKYWRRTAPNALSDEEKIQIREKLLTCIAEPSLQLAKQVAIVIARIARQDVPMDWPVLLPALLQNVRSENALLQSRCLLVLYRITKEMASKRLSGARAVFRELTENSFSYLVQLWIRETVASIGVLATTASGEDPAIVSHLELALLALKSLRQLLVHGTQDLHKNPACVEFLSYNIQGAMQLSSNRAAVLRFGADSTIVRLVDKLMITCCKVLSDVLDNHPDSFRVCLEPFLAFVTGEVFASAQVGGQSKNPRFLIFCMNLIRAVLLCSNYRPVQNATTGAIQRVNDNGKTELAPPDALEACEILRRFFTAELLEALTSLLVSRFLVLTAEDLEEWQHNPENFGCDEEGEAWTFGLRASAEHLLVAMMTDFSEPMCPIILRVLEGASAADTVQKDAVYNALGQCSQYLHDWIDFGTVLLPRIAAELSAPAGNAIMHRRACILCARWVTVRMSRECRPTVFQILISMLGSSDMVVRLAALDALRNCMDDFDFVVEDFQPFVENAFERLLRLLADLTESDRKLRVLNTMEIMIERVGVKMSFALPAFSSVLPQLWQGLSAIGLLQTSIVKLVTKVFDTLGALANGLQGAALQMISVSVNLEDPAHVYLLEDGLQLWQAVLRSSTAPSPELLAAFPRVFPLLQRGDEALLLSLKTIEGYLLLCEGALLQQHGPPLASCFASLIDSLPSEGVARLCKIVDSAMILYGVDALRLFSGTVRHALMVVSLMSDACSSYTYFVSLASRACLVSTPDVLAIAAELSSANSCNVFNLFLEILFEKFDVIIKEYSKKLVGLALIHMLTQPAARPALLPMFPGVVNVFITLINIFHCRSGSFIAVDYLVRPASPPNDLRTNQPEFDRIKALSGKDAVYCANLRDEITKALRAQPDLMALMHPVDPAVRAQLEEALTLRDGEKMIPTY